MERESKAGAKASSVSNLKKENKTGINFLLKKNCKVIGVSRSNEYNKIYLPYLNSSSLKSFNEIICIRSLRIGVILEISLNENTNSALERSKNRFCPKYLSVNFIFWVSSVKWIRRLAISSPLLLSLILSNSSKLIEVVCEELKEIQDKYKDIKGKVPEYYNPKII